MPDYVYDVIIVKGPQQHLDDFVKCETFSNNNNNDHDAKLDYRLEGSQESLKVIALRQQKPWILPGKLMFRIQSKWEPCHPYCIEISAEYPQLELTCKSIREFCYAGCQVVTFQNGAQISDNGWTIESGYQQQPQQQTELLFARYFPEYFKDELQHGVHEFKAKMSDLMDETVKYEKKLSHVKQTKVKK